MSKFDPASPPDVAHRLSSLGYHPLPIVAGSKACNVKDWQTLRIPPSDIPDYWKKGADSGVGLLLGQEIGEGTHVIAIDIDVNEPQLISRIRNAFPVIPPSKKGSKGVTFICRTKEAVKGRKLRRRDRVTGATTNCVEVLATGNQTVLPPSIHPSGMPYEWTDVPLYDIKPHELPLVDQWVIKEIELAVTKPEWKGFGLNDMTSNSGDGGGTIHTTTLEAIASMVALQWDVDAAVDRCLRAARDAVARSGAKEYDWVKWEESVRKMWDDAKAKGFDKVVKTQKEKVAAIVAKWIVNEWVGPGKMRRMGGRLAKYKDGHFVTPEEDDFIYALLHEFPNPQNFSFDSGDLRRIYETARLMAPPLYESKDRPPHKRVCLLNGTFDMDTLELNDWSEKDGLVSQLPFSYDDEAVCPQYDRFLVQTFEDSDPEQSIALWDEFLAHTLFDCLDYQKFLVLKGLPGTGKSTLLHVARMLHSEEAVSSVGVSEFGNERHRTAMVGKLLNLVSEVAATSHAADDFLKSVTSGDFIQVRYLYREPFNVRLMARIIIACNEMFRVRDNSGAIERRMLILTCNNVVKKKGTQEDPKLTLKMKAELPGIFNRLVKAWSRLRERNEFDPPGTHQKQLKEFSEENNHALQWFNERTHQGAKLEASEYKIPSNGHWSESAALYLDFAEWSKLMGFKPMSVITWGGRLTTIGYPSYAKWVGNASLRVRDLGLIHGGTTKF